MNKREGEPQKNNGSTNIPKKMSFMHLVLSSMAAAIGVQSSKNLEEDFSQKSPFPFIVAGILFTVIFMTTLILIVKYVLSDI